MGEGDEVAAVEAALVGFADRDAINLWLDQVLRHLLGVGLDRVDFVAGRIDAAYGVTTDGGLQLLIKVHRPPVDVSVESWLATLNGLWRRRVSRAQTPWWDLRRSTVGW